MRVLISTVPVVVGLALLHLAGSQADAIDCRPDEGRSVVSASSPIPSDTEDCGFFLRRRRYCAPCPCDPGAAPAQPGPAPLAMDPSQAYPGGKAKPRLLDGFSCPTPNSTINPILSSCGTYGTMTINNVIGYIASPPIGESTQGTTKKGAPNWQVQLNLQPAPGSAVPNSFVGVEIEDPVAGNQYFLVDVTVDPRSSNNCSSCSPSLAARATYAKTRQTCKGNHLKFNGAPTAAGTNLNVRAKFDKDDGEFVLGLMIGDYGNLKKQQVRTHAKVDATDPVNPVVSFDHGQWQKGQVVRVRVRSFKRVNNRWTITGCDEIPNYTIP